jgi:hypothetical protein
MIESLHPGLSEKYHVRNLNPFEVWVGRKMAFKKDLQPNDSTRGATPSARVYLVRTHTIRYSTLYFFE